MELKFDKFISELKARLNKEGYSDEKIEEMINIFKDVYARGYDEGYVDATN